MAAKGMLQWEAIVAQAKVNNKISTKLAIRMIQSGDSKAQNLLNHLNNLFNNAKNAGDKRIERIGEGRTAVYRYTGVDVSYVNWGQRKHRKKK